MCQINCPSSSSFYQLISLCAIIFITEPSFVFADVVREGRHKADGEDDKIYYFFTEVSVEYEFFGKLLIPRVARVCKVSTRQHTSRAICSYQQHPLALIL